MDIEADLVALADAINTGTVASTRGTTTEVAERALTFNRELQKRLATNQLTNIS